MSYIPGIYFILYYLILFLVNAVFFRNKWLLNGVNFFRFSRKVYWRGGKVWGSSSSLRWTTAAGSQQTGTGNTHSVFGNRLLYINVSEYWFTHTFLSNIFVLMFIFFVLLPWLADLCAAGHCHSRTFSRTEQGNHNSNIYCHFYCLEFTQTALKVF